MVHSTYTDAMLITLRQNTVKCAVAAERSRTRLRMRKQECLQEGIPWGSHHLLLFPPKAELLQETKASRVRKKKFKDFRFY